ncbi:MAG: LamG domain-containing protein, partial [Bacteroidota bacterium]
MKKILLLTIYFICLGVSAQDISTGLISYYPFTGGVVNDVVGPDLSPTSTMITSTFGYDGEATGAVSVSGDGIIDFGDIPVGNGSFTIAFWIKIPEDIGTTQRNILGKRPVCGEGQFFQIDFKSDATSGNFFLTEQRSNGSVPAPFAENLTLGDWMHVAYVKDNANSESILYINGVGQPPASHGSVTPDFENNASLLLGDSPCTNSTSPLRIIADFDDLRIYDRALSAQDVQAFPSTLFSPLAFSFPENATALTSFFELTSNEAVTFSLGSSKDEALFTLNGAQLSFTNVPDFENPLDGNTDNLYLIDVISTDALGNTSTQELAFTITAADNVLPS